MTERTSRPADRFAAARSQEREARQLFAEARKKEDSAERDVLARAQVVLATLTGLESGVLGARHFAVAVVDEATQVSTRDAERLLRYATRTNTVIVAAETERLGRSVRIEMDQARTALDTLNNETSMLRGSVSVDDRAKVKLRELERENARLKRIVADQALDIDMLKELNRGNF